MLHRHNICRDWSRQLSRAMDETEGLYKGCKCGCIPAWLRVASCCSWPPPVGRRLLQTFESLTCSCKAVIGSGRTQSGWVPRVAELDLSWSRAGSQGAELKRLAIQGWALRRLSARQPRGPS